MTGTHRPQYRDGSGRHRRIVVQPVLRWVPRLILRFAVLLALVPLTVSIQAAAGDIEPILTETDAVAGLPLVMPVRVGDTGQPRSTVTLRFPDGQEVRGVVAAVRFRAPDRVSGWLPPGPVWDVLTPAQAPRDRSGLAWFVLADLPRGTVGQEIWLDGKPVRLRWLSRPAILGMRLGFDPDQPAGPMEDPWASPVPDEWRARADLVGFLSAAGADPTRAWRAALATTGLHPDPEDGSGGTVAITPDLLDASVVEAASAPVPIAERLARTVRAQTAARWRVGLARLWAADPVLSLRVRHALAGAGGFSDESSSRVVAPLWTADDLAAASLLSILLDTELAASERARRAEDWLNGLPDAALWVVDDGVQSESLSSSATIGAMLFSAGDGSAIPMGGGTIGRPVPLRARDAALLRAPRELVRDGMAVYRIAGENRGARINGAVVPLEPPGVATGTFRGDLSMAAMTGGGQPAVNDAGSVPSGLLSVGNARLGTTPGVRVVLRLPGASRDAAGTLLEPSAAGRGWSARVWIGPYARSRAVVLISGSGGAEVQALPGADGGDLPLPGIDLGVDGNDLLIEVALPPEAAEANGLVHLGIEVLDPHGDRTAWPRAMPPWAVEPARRAVDPSAWLGGLGG